MKIKAFDAYNQVLVKLYQLAQEQPLGCFQSAALALIKPLAGFDSAVWGSAATTPVGIDIHAIHLHRVSPDMVAAYEDVKKLDSASGGMLTRLQNTQAFHTNTVFDAHEKRPIRDFMHRFEQPNFLIHTEFNAQTELLDWLTVYRSKADYQFKGADVACLHLLAPHLIQALAFNRAKHLTKLATAHSNPALGGGRAIANMKGRLCALDAQFMQMLNGVANQEFSVGTVLPADLLALVDSVHCREHWQRWGPMVVRLQVEHGLIHVHLRQMQPFDALSGREKTIASFLAQGQTHKQVAATLNRSPATVRNQIQAIYAKLEVCNVAGLIQAIKLSE